jgi:D-beta-D-heptose 7-phosphate kinase/D-beta-D-heptose 1-phosphate adenosyltransferase
LLTELRDRKIETNGVVVDKKRPTTLKTRIIAHGQQMVRFDKENRKPIPQSSINKILEYVESLRKKIGAIVISDYNKGVVSKELIQGIKKIVENSNIFICLDPKQNNFAIYKGVDVITPNHYEVQRAAGMDVTSANDIQLLSKSLLKKYAFPAILVTRGEEGMSLFENGRKIVHTYFSSQAKEVYDVTGAGDTVIGTLALGLAAQASMKEATCLANLAAGLVVEKIGTATVSRKELIDVL